MNGGEQENHRPPRGVGGWKNRLVHDGAIQTVGLYLSDIFSINSSIFSPGFPCFFFAVGVLEGGIDVKAYHAVRCRVAKDKVG